MGLGVSIGAFHNTCALLSLGRIAVDMNPTSARELHRESIIVDAHCDTLMSVLAGTRDIGKRNAEGHIDLPRLKQGGVTAQTFAIFHYWRQLRHRSTAETLRSVDAFYRMLEDNTDTLIHATVASDIERAKQDDKIACILSIEGAEPLAGDPGVLRMFHRLGVRMISLTWNYRNMIADGIGITRGQRGLSKVGVDLVKEMNRLGILVDIAHLAPPGADEVLHITDAPIVASHVAAGALCDHRRNLTDAQLEDIARTGGVACITLVPTFLSSDGSASLEQFIDHMEYFIHIAGIDHVGLGSDYDGYGGVTIGMEDASCWPAVTDVLLTRGYSAEDIQKILGKNLLRVFREVAG